MYKNSASLDEIYTYCTMSLHYMNFPTSGNNDINAILSEIIAHLHMRQLRGMNEEGPNDCQISTNT